jgi:ectoine hydroxylase
MTPEDILSYPARVLSQTQRESYFETGYLIVEKLISDDWIDRLNQKTAALIEASKQVRKSGDFYDIAPEHSASQPRVRRFTTPDTEPLYWEFANDVIADVSADLLGPNVTYHHSKLNFKWPSTDDSNAVGWHQDIPFYPHTNYNVLAIGTYLTDTSDADGPLMVIPGSHNNKLYELYDDQGNWTGELKPKDKAALDQAAAVSLPGPKGSITIHHARAVHGSLPSRASNTRPLLINAYAAADAMPYTDGGAVSNHYREIVRGEPAKWAQHDPRPCPMPPDWSKGYTSIYEQQAKVRGM